MSLSTQPKVRAPELTGRAWINTGGQPLSLTRLRGKIVLLDFWTFCCINCLHVLDELRELEASYADVLVVIGVHSPKFMHEAEHGALVAACERYEVRHPVLDDPQLANWKQYVIRAWPTLVVIDPEGFAVARMSGEGHAHGLRRLLDQIIATHEPRGSLRRGGERYLPPQPEATGLRFPGKAIRLPGGSLLVSDTSQHALAELAPDGTAVLRRIGSGTRGLTDGGPHEAAFSEPQGLCALPARVAEAVGYDVIVADTVNHALRGVRLGTGAVRTVAGTGQQWRRGSATSGPAREVGLPSPWDVAWYDGRVVVAIRHTSALVVRSAGRHGGGARGNGQRRPCRRPRRAGMVRPDLGTRGVRGWRDAVAGRRGDLPPASRLAVSASPPELLADGAGSGTDLSRTLTIAAGPQSGVLHVAAMAASCDDADTGEPGTFPACYVHQQDWGIPVTVSFDGQPELALVLRSGD